MQSTGKCLLLLCLTTTSLCETRDKRHLYHLEPTPGEAYVFDMPADYSAEAAAVQNLANLEQQAYYDSQVPYYDNHQNCDHPAHQQPQTAYYPLVQPVAPITYPVLEPAYYPVADIAPPCPETEVIVQPEIPIADFYPGVEYVQTYPETVLDFEPEPLPVAPAAPCPHTEKVVEKEVEQGLEVVTEAVVTSKPITVSEAIILPCPHSKPVHQVVETGPSEAAIALVNTQVNTKIEAAKISPADGINDILRSGILSIGTLLIPTIPKYSPKPTASPSVVTYEEVTPGFTSSPVPPISVSIEQDRTYISPKPTTFQPASVIQKVDLEIKPIRQHILDHPSSGYVYHQINKDRTVTTYGNQAIESGLKVPAQVETTTYEKKKPCVTKPDAGVKKPCVKPISNSQTSTEKEKIASVQTPKQIEQGSYIYKQVNQDGTITSYSNNVKATPEINVTSKLNKKQQVYTKNTNTQDDYKVPVLNNNENAFDSVGGYVYNQINQDGTVTTYSQGNHVETAPGSVNIQSQNKEQQVYTKSTNSQDDYKVPAIHNTENGFDSVGGYVYNQINQDGTVTTYYQGNHVETASGSVNIQAQNNEQQVYTKNTNSQNHNKIPVIHNVNEDGFDSVGGYHYNQINQDGTVTTYSQGNHVETASGSVNIQSQNKEQQVYTKNTNSQEQYKVPVIHNVNENAFDSVGGYVYNQINQDGTVTTYSQGNHVEKASGSVNIASPSDKPQEKLRGNQYQVIQKANNADEGSVYNQINQDGTWTTYSKGQSFEKSPEIVNAPLFYETSTLVPASIVSTVTEANTRLHEGGYNYQQINQDGTLTTFSKESHLKTLSFDATTPSPFNGGGGYVYNKINQDGSTNSFSQGNSVNTIFGNVNAPPSLASEIPVQSSAGGYVYHQVNQDGTVTSFSGGNNVDTANVNIPPQVLKQEYSTTIAPFVASKRVSSPKIQEINKSTSGSYVYHQSHNDGTVTSYSQSNDGDQAQKSVRKNVICNKKPCVKSVQIDSNGHEEFKTLEAISQAPRLSQLVTDKQIGGYRYQQVHSGGLSVTASGSSVPDFESTTPSLGTLVIGRIHNIINTVPNGKLPINEENVKQPAGFDADQTDYIYKQSYADGTEQTFVASQNLNAESEKKYQFEETTAKSTYSSYGSKINNKPSTYTRTENRARHYKASTKAESNASVEDLPTTKSPSSTNYIYRQVAHGAPEKNYAVVNIGQSYNPPVQEPIASSRRVALGNNPIVVPEDSAYRFKQVRPDGSSFTVRGDRKTTSVVVGEKKRHAHRGDIP